MVSLSSRVAPLLALVTLNLCPPICFAQGPGAAAAVASDWPVSFARCHPVPLRNVETRGFLGDRVTRNGASVLRGVETPLPRGFEARAAGAEPGPETRRLAADSDLYKWMEGAAYMLAITGDKEIEHQLERIGALVIKNQKPDGYINTQVPPALRFDPKINHDLYTAGHFFEAAVAHYRATGRSTLLNAARRWADYLIKEYESGNPYFQTIAQREHSEYELGFLRLYRATGDERYLNLASK
ncbi:MAG: glycoside hydrolase family 127 protein, partial [Bryobacterales bacterium]|nr:glycoside hydrolase family 127 protein [Bryobacterales bacterium]